MKNYFRSILIILHCSAILVFVLGIGGILSVDGDPARMAMFLVTVLLVTVLLGTHLLLVDEDPACMGLFLVTVLL